MKKTYEIPELDIERFLFTDVLTASLEDGKDNLGSGDDGVVDPWDE